jgi:hypothetical protein
MWHCQGEAGGRVHVLISDKELRHAIEGDDRPIHTPGGSKGGVPVYDSVDDAEAAQGFGYKWTAGYSEKVRNSWLAASVTVPSTASIAEQLLTALQTTDRMVTDGDAPRGVQVRTDSPA